MKKKRKNKGIPFDEYYSNGVLELGRVGNLVSLKNNFTEEDARQQRIELAKHYDEKKAEIDELIAEIKRDIGMCNPLALLLWATDRGMMNMLNIVSEIQLSGKQSIELRAVEYIQSVLASQENNFKATDDNQIELMDRILEKVDELYMVSQIFYIFWGAKASIEDGSLKEKDIEYIIEAQLMGSVRGKRYQFLQLINLESLLIPHSEKMEEIYGVSAQDLLEGLKKLELSLSRGKADSIKDLYNEFLEFQEAAEGKSFEDNTKLLDQIRNSKKNLELSNKCFGTNLYDVKIVTGWSDTLIDSLSWNLGECNDFFHNGDFSGWPIVDLPVQKRPFIKIDGVSYCFDYYNLFDNIYRILQKDIKKNDNKYTDKWAAIQQVASETLVESQFKRLLPGCNSYVGNYYPVGKSLKKMDENDILILYDDTMIIAEVKAGSFTYTPAITDFKAHKKSFDALISKADFQCERTLDYIQKNQQIIFYDDKKNEKVSINTDNYKNIFTFCVTVDNFNAFEAKIEKMNFLQISSQTIAISIDDLEVYAEYFDSPLYFLHYLRQRKAATKSTTLMLNDELDHLGMYIVHNNYEMYVSEFRDCDSFVANGYREELDAYFASLYCEEVSHKKPLQEVPSKIKEIITFVERAELKERVSFTSFLLDLAPEARSDFSDNIYALIKRQKEIGRMFPVICNGDIMYGCFVKQAVITEVCEEERLKYMYANMVKMGVEEGWYIVLQYNESEKLQDVEYRKLYIADIDKYGYDKEELEEIAEIIYQRRIRQILEKEHAKKIYPNDPCPCGSGKKFKRCCGKR